MGSAFLFRPDLGVFLAEGFFAVDYFLADFLAEAFGVFYLALAAEAWEAFT